MTNPVLSWEVAMPLLADPVTILPEQRKALEHLMRTHSTPQQLALRARMIVHAADGVAVPEQLADAPRSGAPATYTPEQICAVIAMTCEKPSESERPISHWSQREIADEAMRRGLVPSISQRSVGRFLKKRPTSNHIASVTG